MVYKCLTGYFLNEVMNTGDYVLLMKLRKPMTAGIPLFYREILFAQAQFLEHLQYVAHSVSIVKELPIFMNKYIKKEDKLCEEM